jgi:putative drug exporter of the RND superfamily
MILVPATMTLLGRANWWAPAPLRRLHQRLGLHEAPAHPASLTGMASAGSGRAGEHAQDERRSVTVT